MEPNELYLHVVNGGLTIEVQDNDYGPELVVTQQYLGSSKSTISQKLTPEALTAVAEYLTRMANREYSKTYCMPAYAPSEDPYGAS